MCTRIAIIYNQPQPCRYSRSGEEAAVAGVLEEVEAASAAVRELGYEVSCIPLSPPIEQAEKLLKRLEADLVFNLFEGFCGCPSTEADMADILAAAGLPFSGCSGTTLRLALDKAGANRRLRQAGVETPESMLVDNGKVNEFSLDFPCIVKPAADDASHGLTEKSVVNNMAGLVEQLQEFGRSYNGQAMVEEFIEGREFNITIMGNGNGAGYSALPVSEIVYTLPPDMPELLTYSAKWRPESLYYKNTRVLCPAEVTDEERKDIENTAITACSLLGCRGYARVDMRMENNGKVYVLEVNPNPDISPSAGAARHAGAAGLTYTRFIERIMQLALK